MAGSDREESNDADDRRSRDPERSEVRVEPDDDDGERGEGGGSDGRGDENDEEEDGELDGMMDELADVEVPLVGQSDEDDDADDIEGGEAAADVGATATEIPGGGRDDEEKVVAASRKRPRTATTRRDDLSESAETSGSGHAGAYDDDAAVRCFGLALRSHGWEASDARLREGWQPMELSPLPPPSSSSSSKRSAGKTSEGAEAGEEEGEVKERRWKARPVPLPSWAVDPFWSQTGARAAGVDGAND